MEREGSQPHRGTDDQCHGDDQDQRQHRLERSIRPGVPCPETVLVAVMSDGSYLLVGYPRGELAAFVVGEEAEQLKQALAGTFGNPQDEPANGNGSETPEHETLSTKQGQA